ncbi:unnamed protein product [Rhodiola kirilowii]
MDSSFSNPSSTLSIKPEPEIQTHQHHHQQQQPFEQQASKHGLKPYRGIRMRKWGKWVAEIREPNKRSRIWLGSYTSPIAAARAYDTAVFLLRGPTARLNFPDSAAIWGDRFIADLSAAAVRKRATEVGSRVDAYEAAIRSAAGSDSAKRVVAMKPDLNQYPDPETSDED